MSIKIHQLEHVYNPNTPFSHAALKGINLEIPEGKVTAIIGQTGSGKSTLVQHLNGLLIPTAAPTGTPSCLSYPAIIENKRCKTVTKRGWVGFSVSRISVI